MQAEEVEQERYTDLTKALQNPLDVLILDLNGDELTFFLKKFKNYRIYKSSICFKVHNILSYRDMKISER